MLLPIPSKTPAIFAMAEVPVWWCTHSSCLQKLHPSPLLWGLAEDVSPSPGSWGTAVSDGVYDLLLLLPIPIALACGAWLLRNRSVRWQWCLSLGLQQIRSVNL